LGLGLPILFFFLLSEVSCEISFEGSTLTLKMLKRCWDIGEMSSDHPWVEFKLGSSGQE
jgi:hypothetical protein